MVFRNPTPTVDVVVHRQVGFTTEVLLIQRNNPPLGWALPGSYVDEGERVETAAIREVEEETGVVVTLDHLLYVSDPQRDRQHNLAIVFTSDVTSKAVSPVGNDDAIDARFFSLKICLTWCLTTQRSLRFCQVCGSEAVSASSKVNTQIMIVLDPYTLTFVMIHSLTIVCSID